MFRFFRRTYVTKDDIRLQQINHYEDEIFFLRKKVSALERERSLLLDRVLHISTGAPLEIPKAAPLTEEERKAVREGIDRIAEDKPFGGLPTFHQLMAYIEDQTFKEDAERTTGYTEVVDGAEVQNAEEAETEEQKTARLARIKATQQAAARSMREYLTHTKPVRTSE